MSRPINIRVYPPGLRPKKQNFPVFIQNWLAFSEFTITPEGKIHKEKTVIFIGGESKEIAEQTLRQSISQAKRVPEDTLHFKISVIRN